MWPDKFIIVDDTDNYKFVNNALQDLSWVNDFVSWLQDKRLSLLDEENIKRVKDRIESLPNEVKKLAKIEPYFFRDLVVSIRIEKEENIASAKTELMAPGPIIAFIDFNYRKSSVSDRIYNNYELLPKNSPWKKVSEDEQKGGCYFCSLFTPSVNSKKVLCPTTMAEPRGLIRNLPTDERNAITEPISLHEGLLAGPEAVIVALNKWIEIQNICPLVEIWRRTKNWFSVGHYDVLDEKHMPHSLTGTLSDDFIKNYMETVEDVFELKFPSEWQSTEAVSIIHDSIEHLCGHHYCGTVVNGKYNLTIGSVYLITLLAMRDSGNYYDLFQSRDKVIDIGKLRGMRSDFLNIQPEHDAKQSAKSIYFFLKNLFAQDLKHKDADDQLPKLNEYQFQKNGKKMQFQFSWNANTNNGLATKVLKEKLRTPDSPDYATVMGSLSSLWSMLIRSKDGFGGPGAIWMSGSVLYIASANSESNVLIICHDDRYEKWAKVFLEADADSIYVLRKGSERRKVDKTNINIGGQIIAENETLPKDICCALIHSGNKDLWDKNKLNVQTAFWFDSPGDPSAPDTDLSVRRQTSPLFDITIDDAQQILHYSIGYEQKIPDCCTEKQENHILPALTILCQGYLAVHAEHKEQNKDWKDQDIAIALEQMGWDSVDKSLVPQSFGEKESIEKVRNPGWWWAAFEDDFKNKDKKSLSVAIQEEWDMSGDKEISKELEDLIKLIVADNEVKSPEMVAKAHLALVKKLGV